MGKILLATGQYALAVKWLDRALDMISSQELENLSMDASELRISIIQSTVKARIQLKDAQLLEQARDHISVLENELGDRLIVLALRLEILNAATGEDFDSNTFGDVLGRIIRSVVLNDENFKLVMFHIRRLHASDSALACKLLCDLTILRIVPEKENDRQNRMIEKALITRVWMAAGQKETTDTLLTTADFLDVVLENFPNRVSSTASLAAQTVRDRPTWGVVAADWS